MTTCSLCYSVVGALIAVVNSEYLKEFGALGHTIFLRFSPKKKNVYIIASNGISHSLFIENSRTFSTVIKADVENPITNYKGDGVTDENVMDDPKLLVQQVKPKRSV